ncbi:MAG TPA: hypothetical protein VIS48_12720 [Candidatus Kryptonia bacterium]
MRCPFLREAQVKFCCASEYRKMIVRGQTDPGNERCSSPAFITCPASKQHQEEKPPGSRCPFLQESLAQYCSAASVVKFVPYSDPAVSRCGTSSHNYCELFLTISNPNRILSHDAALPSLDPDDAENSVWLVDGIQTTGWHYYSPNHMWADINEEGTCHVGVDAFLAKVLGSIERLSFTTEPGDHYPGAVVTSNGIDFPMVFPNRMNIVTTNSYLRAEPSRVVTDPYTFGWLFEGTELARDKGQEESPTRAGLIHGKLAREWMRADSLRIAEFARKRSSLGSDNNSSLMTDGGVFGGDTMKHLDEAQALLLYSEFFSPNIKWENR